jgi:hypothetical protein
MTLPKFHLCLWNLPTKTNTSATPPPHYKQILRYMWFDTANTMLRSTIFLNQSWESQMWIPNKIIEELKITSPHNNQQMNTVRSSCKLQSYPLRNTGFQVQKKMKTKPLENSVGLTLPRLLETELLLLHCC